MKITQAVESFNLFLDYLNSNTDVLSKYIRAIISCFYENNKEYFENNKNLDTGYDHMKNIIELFQLNIVDTESLYNRQLVLQTIFLQPDKESLILNSPIFWMFLYAENKNSDIRQKILNNEINKHCKELQIINQNFKIIEFE
jgi:hypothetical protein